MLTLPCILAGCTTATDQRQEFSSSSLGLIFFGTVRVVYLAKSGLGGETFYDLVPQAYFDERAQFPPGIPGPETLLFRVLGAASGALFKDIETSVSQSKCIYIVKTEDAEISQFVRQNVLNAYDENRPIIVSNDFLGDENDFGDDTLDSFSQSASQPEPPKVPEIRKYISVGQTCNSDLIPGKDVIMTLNNEEATIHPIDTETTRIKEEVTADIN